MERETETGGNRLRAMEADRKTETVRESERDGEGQSEREREGTMSRRGAGVFERREAEDKRIFNTDLQPAAQQRIRPDTCSATTTLRTLREFYNTGTRVSIKVSLHPWRA